MEEQYKVLIAEDEKGLRDILSKFLQKKGFEVDVVGDGDSACHAVDEKVYDIIVLDIMMPGRNGKEVVLAPKEYDLLMYMIENKNQVLSRDQILDKVWGMEYEGYDRAVDTHIKKLRAALGKASYHVETVIKAGYMWR